MTKYFDLHEQLKSTKVLSQGHITISPDQGSLRISPGQSRDMTKIMLKLPQIILQPKACANMDFFYPRATRCDGDIVTLLWFRASMRGSCEHDRDYTVACFFVKLGRHVNHVERMNPIDFGGQRSRSQWTYMEITL